MFRIRNKSGRTPGDVSAMLRLTRSGSGNPNINDLWRITKDIEATKLTVKFFGYELAKALLAALPPLPPGGPFSAAQTCRASTQADLEANWSRYWSAQLREAHRIHRRAWENAFVLQAIAQAGKLQAGAKGLVVGPGDGPLVSYLAARGCAVTVVDTSAPTADTMFRSNLVDRATFDRNVTARAADLNALPQDLRGFDFCISVSRIHMLGSIARGIRFMESMTDVLKPGGVAAHTTEYSFAIEDQTIDNWGTVLFQRPHFEDMIRRMAARGCRVAPADFSIGNRPLDRFIDVPMLEAADQNLKDWSQEAMHIKFNIDGFPCTAFGLVAVKNP